MIGAIASAALLVAASLVVGQAVLWACDRRRWTWLAGPVGLALLFVAAGLTAAAGGQGTAIAITSLLLLVVSGAVLIGQGRVQAPGRLGPALAAGTLAALIAAIPFIAANHVGILGVGLVNDDMASHLLLADWIDERFRPEPVLIDQGYPIGPHALVAGLSELLGARTIDVFAGLVLAIPALTALVAFAALERVRTAWRVLAAALVALPYLAAAYLAQEAFKEPTIALFLLAFALVLPAVRSPRGAIPLGVIAAGTVYVYSFPGLAWLAGVAAVLAVVERARGRAVRRVSPAALVAVAALLLLALPDLARLLDFVDFRALDPDRANEGGLGNLRDQLSPLEALGIWPTSDFRLDAGAGSLPAIAFYAGAALAALAFATALPRWLRRHGPVIPAALLTAVALYLAARAFGTVYTSAKALAIAAPFITLITLGGLLSEEERKESEGGSGSEGDAHPEKSDLARGWVSRARGALAPLPALAAVFATAATASSFLILRQAPVAPEAHMKELAQIRPLVQGEKLLFLGRDNFILHSLRGSKPFTAVRNFYDPYYVQPNLELDDVFSKFDFDSVRVEDLARFPHVLATRAGYQSGPPPGYEPVAETDSYVLWERGEPPTGRVPGESGAEPGRVHGCDPADPPRGPIATFATTPVVGDWSAATIEDGERATVRLRLSAGTWELSIQYDSTRSLRLSAPGFEHTLPGNLDYRGSVPFLPAGRIEVPSAQTVEITARVEPPPLAGRLLGGRSVAHLGSIAATAPAGSRIGSGGEACRGYVDWYVP